ncbi:hypothetical protein L485_19675 [Sphingobium baderi LL03]|uniref:Uncharacterized protein n=1 Tax=Sphingobium baderi LL03 TaxID=1114964 RepID=T0HEZ2_9SPHN|nr:hypothetical protein L485_19675 [Sphingobium baderi LL03]
MEKISADGAVTGGRAQPSSFVAGRRMAACDQLWVIQGAEIEA